VLVSNGIYDEAVTVSNGRSLLGGYQWDTWARSVAGTSTQISGVSSSGAHDRTLIAIGITTATVVEGFVIRGSVNGKTGGNSYAVYVSGSNANLSIRSNLIIGGRGGPGATGTAGTDGQIGANGIGRASNPAGYDAKIATGTTVCDASNNRSYANGGVRTCNGDVVSGGSGGGNRCRPVSNLTEFSGIDGATGDPGAGGAVGGTGADAGDDMRLENNGNLCYVPAVADYGANGNDGQAASHGTAALGCSGNAGSVVGGHWVGGSGAIGSFYVS
jgi:hypothetical protein